MKRIIFEEINQTLNPKLFDSKNNLKSDIRSKLLEISDEFLEQVSSEMVVNPIDIRLVGSNASYNYSSTSDIDLHIVVDLSEICKECPEIVQFLFNSEKSRFNLQYDISLKRVQVEIYVEDIRAGTMSNGIYSVLEDNWIKFPQPLAEGSLDITDKELLNQYINLVQYALNQEDSEEITSIINQLYLLRKNSLESDGEYGQGNLIFKEIRNKGLLDKLKDKYYEIRSKELSLESLDSIRNWD